MSRRWEPDEVEILADMHANGHRFADIADVLDRTPGAVGQMARKMGLVRCEKWSQSEVEDVCRMYRDGWTMREIGEVTDRSPMAISVVLSKRGASRRKQRLWTADEVRYLVKHGPAKAHKVLDRSRLACYAKYEKEMLCRSDRR